jgi:hypothetical protein
MFLSLSHSHYHLSIKRRTARIPLRPVDLSSHLRVQIDAGVDGGVAVRLGRVVGVPGVLGRRRLALVGQGPSHELVAVTASMCGALRKKKQVGYKLCIIERHNKEMNLHTHLALYWSLLRLP